MYWHFKQAELMRSARAGAGAAVMDVFPGDRLTDPANKG